MIVLDLEWNRGYDKKPLDEILQIGAVRLENPYNQIVDTFNICILPLIHKSLNRPAKQLPMLEDIQTSGLIFPKAMELFRAWCGQEQIFAVWGGDDVDILRQNCSYWQVPCVEAEVVYDFQAAFSRRVETRQSVALYRAVEYCGIPDSFTYHNALNDAMYTALVGGWLREKDLNMQEIPRQLRKLAETVFPPQPRRKLGRFLTIEAALNSPACRQQACPLCAAEGWIQQWYFHRGVPRYYGAHHCPQHGWFLCRLTFSRCETGGWRAHAATPAPTLRFLQEFYAAAQDQSHICKKLRRISTRRKQNRRPIKQRGPDTDK